jgi:hypothetical protein
LIKGNRLAKVPVNKTAGAAQAPVGILIKNDLAIFSHSVSFNDES